MIILPLQHDANEQSWNYYMIGVLGYTTWLVLAHAEKKIHTQCASVLTNENYKEVSTFIICNECLLPRLLCKEGK